ncbi:hypothetical protein BKA61DRAFT_73577 [Leptodontidium sp. MPI-SDFR-AT-0119]|nr:hypothetical protein BKA61DRAFT_73577 [Leptodontidium sp. MPI-SDFR-AT-0119]
MRYYHKHSPTIAQVNLKVMKLVLAVLALALTFVSASPIKRDSEHGSHELDLGSAYDAQLAGLGHVFREVIAGVTSPPPPPPPPVLDNCGVIYIARDGQFTKTAPPGCPTNSALGARETRAVENVPEIDPDGDGGFYIARANAAELNFQSRTGPNYVGPLPLVSSPAPVLSYIDKQVKNLPPQTSSFPPISSRPPIYIARHDSVHQKHFPTNVPEPVRVNIDPRQTASPGGPVQGGNGGVIYIARVEESEDDALKPPEQTGGDGTIYIAREEHVSAPPQQTGGDGGIWIARRQHNTPPPPGGDMTGCIIYIARDGKGTSKTPPPGCPTPQPQRVRDLPPRRQQIRSSDVSVGGHILAKMRQDIERFENRMENVPTIPNERTDVMRRKVWDDDELVLRRSKVERDIQHKPPFNTLFSPGLTTLTVSASTGRQTGGVLVITGPQSETIHKTHPSKTKSTILPGTFTVTGGSGTFTVITTHPANFEHTRVLRRIPPPGWLSAHTTAETHVRPTNKPVGWGSSATAKATTHIQTLDKHTFTWKHKTHTSIEDPTHIHPTNKPVTLGLEARTNVPASTPTLKPAPSPSCTLTVKTPTVTMMGNVKTVHPSTTIVTQYHSCGGCCSSLPRL